jgi:hypothetical protein
MVAGNLSSNLQMTKFQKEFAEVPSVFTRRFAVCRLPFACIRKSIMGPALLLFSCAAHAVEFPDTAHLKKEYAVSKRGSGLPVEFFNSKGKDTSHVRLVWQKGSIVQAGYWRSVPFDDSRFSKLASFHGKGAVWHELPVTDSEKMKLWNTMPGLEQQWILRGYAGESGWMGTGLHENRFFIIFRREGPSKLKYAKGPLRLTPGLVNELERSGNWVSSPCSSGTSGRICFTCIGKPQMTIFAESKGPFPVVIWLQEKNPIFEIRQTIRMMRKEQYHEYSRELSDFSVLEAQSVISKILPEIPDLFTWPSWQVQEQVDMRIQASDYMKMFTKYGNEWPFLPVLEYRSKEINLVIRLHFDGSYQLLIGEP